MNIDVEIYLSQFKTFFKDNPNEFYNLIGKGQPDDFFNEVKNIATKNHENGEDIELTKKQLIEVVLKINHMNPEDEAEVVKNIEPFMEHRMGKICLN